MTSVLAPSKHRFSADSFWGPDRFTRRGGFHYPSVFTAG
jgi:hypothetical protein